MFTMSRYFCIFASSLIFTAVTGKDCYIYLLRSLGLVLYQVSLCSPGWPQTDYVDQVGIKLTHPPASDPDNTEIKGVHYHTCYSGF